MSWNNLHHYQKMIQYVIRVVDSRSFTYGKWQKIVFTVAILAQGTLLRHGKHAGLFA